MDMERNNSNFREEKHEISLYGIISIFVRRKVLFLLTMLIIFILGIFFVYPQRTMYQFKQIVHTANYGNVPVESNSQIIFKLKSIVLTKLINNSQNSIYRNIVVTPIEGKDSSFIALGFIGPKGGKKAFMAAFYQIYQSLLKLQKPMIKAKKEQLHNQLNIIRKQLNWVLNLNVKMFNQRMTKNAAVEKLSVKSKKQLSAPDGTFVILQLLSQMEFTSAMSVQKKLIALENKIFAVTQQLSAMQEASLFGEVQEKAIAKNSLPMLGVWFLLALITGIIVTFLVEFYFQFKQFYSK